MPTWYRQGGGDHRDGGSVDALPLVGGFIPWLLVATATLLALDQSVGLRAFVLGTDFRALYTGGRMLLGGIGPQLYHLPTQYAWQREFAPELGDPSQLLPFLNPPFVAIALALVAKLPFEAAYLVWAGLNVALLAVVCRVLVQTLGGVDRSVKFRALAISLTFPPILIAFIQGQLSLVLVLALLSSWRALERGRDFRGGLWVALLLIKPHLAFVPAVLLAWQRRISAIAGLGLGGGILLLVSLLLVGWRGLQGYMQLLMTAVSWHNRYGIHPERMHTWHGFLYLLAADNPIGVQRWWLVGVVLSLGLLLWSTRRWSSSARFSLQWALMVNIALFSSRHANFHDLSLLVVPSSLTVRYLATRQEAGPADKLLTMLSFLGGWAMVASLLWSSGLRLQISVLFVLLNVAALTWALTQLKS